MKTEIIRLGVLGPGAIFRRIMADLYKADGLVLTAIASRDLARAQDAAREFGVPIAYGSYEELANSPDVDLVYIATPHNFHKDQAIMCMEQGKHVVCEKPMALSDAEVQAMIDCAKRNNVFLMEAMWTRFFPAAYKLRELMKTGAIGKISHISADFCFSMAFDPENRLFARELAGGALLDLGIYPLSAVSMVMNAEEPTSVNGLCTLAPSGVDDMDHVQLSFKGGATASILCGMHAPSAQMESILGDAGRIEIPDFWHPTSIRLFKTNGELVVFTFDPENEGHYHQFQHACECIKKGIIDSPIMPLSETLMLSRVMTKLRREWGVSYPEEE